MPIILDGRALSKKIKAELQQRIASYGALPSLAIVRVGDNPDSKVYVERKAAYAAGLGLEAAVHHFPAGVTQGELESRVQALSDDDSVHGIIIQLPLSGGLDVDAAIAKIDPRKDVDGLAPFNTWALYTLAQGKGVSAPHHLPATARGVIALLREHGIQIAGKHAVVVGRSKIAGLPTANLLLAEGSTVTVCHSKTEDLSGIVKKADIAVFATGLPEFADQSFFSPNQAVVDIGITRTEEGIKGDVRPEVKDFAAAVSPVPGGVGPMTVASLFQNLCDAYEMLALR